MIILHDRYHAIVVWAFFKERRSFLEFSISLNVWVCLHLLNHIYMLGILNDAIALFRAHSYSDSVDAGKSKITGFHTYC